MPWVLEFFEVLDLHAIHIRQNGFESTTTFISNSVLFVGEPSQEVIHTDVVRVFDDVMDEPFVGVAFGIEEDGTRFVVEGSEHETVRALAIEVAHSWVCKPSFAVVFFPAFFAHSWTMHRLHFNAIRAHEVALVGVRPKDFSAG